MILIVVDSYYRGRSVCYAPQDTVTECRATMSTEWGDSIVLRYMYFIRSNVSQSKRSFALSDITTPRDGLDPPSHCLATAAAYTKSRFIQGRRCNRNNLLSFQLNNKDTDIQRLVSRTKIRHHTPNNILFQNISKSSDTAGSMVPRPVLRVPYRG